MVAAKKVVHRKIAVLHSMASLFAMLFLSCGNHGLDSLGGGQVTFYNESSYSVVIHHASFSGIILGDTLASGSSFSTTVSPSDNYGTGSVFSIEYWFMISENVWIGSIDPNAQIIRNIEVGKSYEIHIPQPVNFHLSEAFIKIINTSSMPIEFHYLSKYYKQAGSGETAIPSRGTGFYKVDFLDDTEIEFKYHSIAQIFEEYPFPEFTAKKGYIYIFEFDGNTVEPINEQKITL
jgi:hypothetical protein